MVRRDDDGIRRPEGLTNPVSRSVDPAGERFVSVGGDAPSSRLPASGEIQASVAQCRKPDPQRELRDGEQVRGPQHEVKSAASSQQQPEGRGAHVTAKATPTTNVEGLGGVRTAAKLILEPIFEVGFKDCSYGFRPKRSTTQALERSAWK
jgi:hypothetical protein